MSPRTSEQTDIEWIKASLQRVEKKVDDLDSFKWKMVGAGTLIGILLTLAIAILEKH